MMFLSRLFNQSTKENKAPTEYKGFLIYPDAQAESGQFRISGRITKNINHEIKTHDFIRSDRLQTKIEADELMVQKAQLFIDQMGESMF